MGGIPKLRTFMEHNEMAELEAIAHPGLIPNPIDQNPCAHWRKPMDMMRQG